MSDVALTSPVTDAILAALKTTTGRPIGDGAKPPSPNKPPVSFYPYAILRVSTPTFVGSYVKPHEDGLHRVYVTANGLTRDSVDWMLERAAQVILDPGLDIDGHVVVWAEKVDGKEPDWDTDVSPPVIYGVAVFRLYVTPADSGS